MSDQKIERQLNLLFVLLNTKIPIEREEIRKRVPGYFGKSNEAFERMFERDKENLRDLGIPIEAVSIDTFHEDNIGYLIREANWLLPDINLTAAERTLLNLAAAAWAHSALNASEIVSALDTAVKRLSTRREIEPKIEFSLSAQAQHIEKVIRAKSTNKCVEFTYFSVNSRTQETRLVAPWRIYLSRGSSYLIGFDQAKGEPRVFKLSRIIGQVIISSEEAIEPAPDNLDVAQMVGSWQSAEHSAIDLDLEILPNSGGELRLLAAKINYGEFSDHVEIKNVITEQVLPLLLRNCDVIKIISPKEIQAELDLHLAGIV